MSRTVMQVSILVVFVLLVITSLVRSSIVQSRLNDKTTCQAKYNAEFGAAITQRAAANKIIQDANDADRENIVKLLTEVATVKDPATFNQDLSNYLNAAQAIQSQRDQGISQQAKNPVPDVSQLRAC